jgi:hypothetical protein
MVADFEPGFGSPVGRFLKAVGEVIIVHEEISQGYWATEALPLFAGDAIYTLDQGSAELELNDGSIITMTELSRLTINQSVFDPDQKIRSTFLNMSLGKIRFWVIKLLGYNRSEFKVKTPTAICGVRGSEFIIVATAEWSEITALEDTQLEVVSLFALDAPPIVITDFTRSIVEEGLEPTPPAAVSPEELQQLREEVSTDPRDKTKDSAKAQKERKDKAAESSKKGIRVKVEGEEGLLVSPAGDPSTISGLLLGDEAQDQLDAAKQEANQILEDKYQDDYVALPDFPGRP